jgi:copper chaperone CopZ
MQTIHLTIPGMHCASCAALIKDVSADFPAIQSVDVNLQTKTVTLECQPELDVAALSTAIESLGDAYKIISKS